MSSERPIIGITEELVDGTLDDNRWDEETADSFAAETLDQMGVEQPDLQLYVKKAIDTSLRSPDSTLISAVMTYRMLPEQIRGDRLNADQINTAHRSFFESQNSTPSKSGNPTINVSWAFEKLMKDSPAYVTWLDAAAGTFSPDEQPDFVRGALTILVPFYMRGEARRMEQKLK